MLSRISKLLIVIVTFFSIRTNDLSTNMNEKMEAFSMRVNEECIDYLVDDEVYVVFDYTKVKEIAKETFISFETKIDKESESAFVITITKLNKEIKEKFYIDKGDMYEENN